MARFVAVALLVLLAFAACTADVSAASGNGRELMSSRALLNPRDFKVGAQQPNKPSSGGAKKDEKKKTGRKLLQGVRQYKSASQAPKQPKQPKFSAPKASSP